MWATAAMLALGYLNSQQQQKQQQQASQAAGQSSAWNNMQTGGELPRELLNNLSQPIEDQQNSSPWVGANMGQQQQSPWMGMQ